MYKVVSNGNSELQNCTVFSRVFINLFILVEFLCFAGEVLYMQYHQFDKFRT